MDAEDHFRLPRRGCPPSHSLFPEHPRCRTTEDMQGNGGTRRKQLSTPGGVENEVTNAKALPSPGYLRAMMDVMFDVWCPSSFFGRSIAHLLMFSFTFNTLILSTLLSSPASYFLPLVPSSLALNSPPFFTIRLTGKRADERTDQQPERSQHVRQKAGCAQASNGCSVH